MLFAFAAAMGLPAEPGCSTLPGTSVLTIPVRAITHDGKALEKLTANDFLVALNRVPQKICGFSHLRYPVSVGILLDASASMRGAYSNVLELAKAGISQLLDAAGPQDEFFLEYVNAGAEMRCIFSCDREHIRSGLNVRPEGKTALIDAIYLALRAMQKAHFPTRSLVVVSDGYDNASIYELKELERAFSESPIPIFLILPTERWRSGSQGSPEEVSRRLGLEHFANQSGGIAIAVRDRKEMATTVTHVFSVIHSPYMLYLPKPQPGSRHNNFHIKVKGVRPGPILLYNAIYSWPRPLY